MRIISANITGSLILNGVDVTDSLVSSSIISSSVNSKLNSLQSSTSSLNSFTSSYSTGSFTGSFKGDGSNLYNIPATGVTGLQLDKIASGAVTASVSSNGFNINSNVAITGSIVASGTSLVSGSSQVNITGTTGYSTFSSSISTSIGSLSSSVATTTVGTKNRVDSIEAKTGSYATTGSNTFIGTENITGNLTVTGSVIISSGSAVYNSSLNLTDTSSLTLNSGSNLYVYDSGIISGTFKGGVTGSLGINGNVSITGSIVASGTSLVSGSSQIDITSTTNYTTFSSSVSSSIGNLSSSVATNTSGLAGRIATIEGRGATTGSNTFIGTQTITGSLFISSDLIVQGSSSLQDITASAVNIGANIVNLNTANPAIRFAGLNIFDSGSIGGSGSFLYDAVQDEFIFIHRGDNANITSSVVLMGPQTYNNIGSEIYPTANRILKGTGNEHVGDSIISETGGGIGISGSLSVTGSVLVGIDKGIIFDSSGASGNPEISIDSNVDLNFKNTAGLTNLKLKNNGDLMLSGSLTTTGTSTFCGTTGNRLTLYNSGSNGGVNGLLIDSDLYPAIMFNSRLTTSGGIIGGGKIIYNSIATGYGSDSLGGALLLQGDNALQFSTGGDNVRMSITTAGATTFSCGVTAVGDIRSNAIFRDYQGEALMTTSGSENQFGSQGAVTPRSVKIFAGNQVALTIDTNRTTTFMGASTLFCGNIGLTCTSAKFYQVTNNCKSADSVLDIYNTASNGFGVSIQAGANDNNYALAVSNYLGTSLLHVAGNGYVGIGTGTPNAKLTINSGNATNSVNIYGSNASYISQLGWYDSTNVYPAGDGVGGQRVALIEIGTVAGSGTGCRGANMALYTHEANGTLKLPLFLTHTGNICFNGNLYTTCTLFAPGTPIQIVTGTANTTSGSSGSSASLGSSAGGASPTYNAGCLITSVSFTPKSSSSKILIQTNSVALWETQNVADHFYLWAANDSAGNVLVKSGAYLPLFGGGNHGAIINLNGTANSWGTSTNTISFRIGTSGGPGNYYQWNPWYGAGGFNSDTVGHFSYTIMEIAQ